MSRARKALRDAAIVPDPRKRLPEVVTVNRIGIVETWENGQPKIRIAGPSVSGQDMIRLLTIALETVTANEDRMKGKIVVPAGLPPEIAQKVDQLVNA